MVGNTEQLGRNIGNFEVNSLQSDGGDDNDGGDDGGDDDNDGGDDNGR